MKPNRFLLQQGVFVLSSMGLIVINLIWLIPTERNIRSSASLFALTVAERIHAEINSSLESVMTESLGAADELTREPDRRAIILQQVLREHRLITSIAVINRVGKEVVRAEHGGFAKPEDLRDHARNPALYLALQGASAFGIPDISPQNEPYAFVAVPIRRKGFIEEVLIAEINLQNFVSVIRSPRIGKGQAYILDQDGSLILHPDLHQVLSRKNFSTRPIVKKILIDGIAATGLAPEDTYLNEQNQRTFTVGLPISIVKWGLFVEQPRSQALAAVNQARILAAGTTLMGIILILIIARNSLKLQRLSQRQQDLLFENDQSAKMLVRRDIELTHVNERLQELDRTKSEFVSVAAHQLRTPLTGLRWSYQALLDNELGRLNSRQQKILHDSLQATLQMIALINNLLNVARIEEGRFGFAFKSHDIVPILDKLALQFTKLAAQKGIRFTFHISEGHFPPLYLDEEKIAIAIVNLLDNAIKYTSPGGTVSLNVYLDPTAVRIEVRDTGIGVPKKQLSRIFTKFFRADNALLFQTTGSGLGLYVVKEIVEHHDGRINIESEENKGTAFIIFLPIKKSV